MPRIGLVDCSWGPNPQRLPPYPSPTLLRAGANLTAEGHTVSYLGTVATSLEVDRVVLLAPPWCDEANRERAALIAKAGVPASAIEMLDPWAAAPSDTLPAYALARHECHGEVDLGSSPVHPWVVPSAGATPPAAAEARLRAAVAGLAGLRSAALVLGDERIAFTEDRLRFLAELVSGSLRERKSIVHLHLRAWPGDLAGERMLDHLSLLPVSSLDLLVGTLHGPSLEQRKSPMSAPELAAVVGAVETAGLGGLTTLSICAGLPGETIEEGVAVLDSTLRLAAKHGIARVRVSLWCDGGAPPKDQLDQKERFLASHPSWSEAEYRGFHDLVAVIRGVAPNIDLIGPGYLPEWDEVP